MSRKQIAARAIARTILRTRMRSSSRSRQRNGAAAKNASIDMYGTIMSGTNGIHRSQSNRHVPTSVRREVSQLAEPYTTTKKVHRAAETAAARRNEGRGDLGCWFSRALIERVPPMKRGVTGANTP